MGGRQRYLMSSTVFIVLRQGRDFCAIKRMNTGWMDGCYSLPAGRVEEGETLLEAACREAFEEIGVRVESRDLRLEHTLHCKTLGESWIGHFFVTAIWNGTPTICEPDKHGDLNWFPFHAIPEDFVSYVRIALTGLANGEPFSTYGF
jgi:8-oxo-dGTP diphosphatase